MAIKERMSGNEAVSYAIRQINPDVMPAFPITPSTEIPQMVSTYIANGEMDTEFIPVESETFFHECNDWCRGSRCEKFDGYFFCRTRTYVGRTSSCRIESSATCYGVGKPYIIRSD